MLSPRAQAVVLSALLALPAVHLQAQTPSQAPKLIPIPRELHTAPGVAASVTLPLGVHIACATCQTAEGADDKFAADDLSKELSARNIPTLSGNAYTIQLVRRPDANFTAEMRPEGYTISATSAALTVTAVTAEGLFYGVQTVKQLITGDGAQAAIHPVAIRDWPAMKYRGYHDDISRGPVPTLEFQKKLIRTLAAYKVNLYSPYFEHTQQYASNPLPAPPGGSISAEDARALVTFARQYHVTIVPEQEAFGHLRHDLIWETYAPIAETPHGAVFAPGQPGSLKVIGQMFTELAGLYPGPFLHIGADETIDLGIGQTKPAVDARGLAAVYLDFLDNIVNTLKPLNRRILFWGDVAQDSPALLKAMPQSFKDQTVAVAWGYTYDAKNPRAFEKALHPFRDAGFETWVAPAVNNYRQVYPNQQMALEDIQQFTYDGQRLGATGQLNTEWNDDGESLVNMNWYGVLFGAAAAWQPGQSSIPAFQQSFGEVFHGDRTGLIDQAQMKLTDAMALLHDAKIIGNTEGTDGLFWVDPWSKDGQTMAAKLRPLASAVRLDAENALVLIAQAKAASGHHPPLATSAPGTFYDASVYGAATSNLREPDAIDAMELGARRIDFLALKFQLADEMAAGYSRAYLASNSTDPKLKRTVSRELSDINGVNGRIQDLTYGYSQLRDLFESAWLASNRPSGLRPVLEHYDATVALWIGRMDKVRVAQRQWADSKTLPTASELGIPAPTR
ncbi:Glycosyl hydrolase family 20, catalytic domain [Granulicella rosea]|uniref:beta-N-acetylhexosaminidase n=1 Tax=Granulicella rosea TaxID=474952 RepID=A0A239HNN5_9BACT|nr:glycoside hydrolase family 20 zincin-like fold domain-containing protein [Granulicella rosea]SNS82977.1 Glycosyl hydrolase family 20, catalytic domain [Granulicella rosea]